MPEILFKSIDLVLTVGYDAIQEDGSVDPRELSTILASGSYADPKVVFNIDSFCTRLGWGWSIRYHDGIPPRAVLHVAPDATPPEILVEFLAAEPTTPSMLGQFTIHVLGEGILRVDLYGQPYATLTRVRPHTLD